MLRFFLRGVKNDTYQYLDLEYIYKKILLLFYCHFVCCVYIFGKKKHIGALLTFFTLVVSGPFQCKSLMYHV